MAANIRPPLLIVTAFWTYVAASNVLYANNMEVSLAALHVAHFLAPWQARLMQHLFLYPLLLAGIFRSLQIGWQPVSRCLPRQLLLGGVFAISATPALWLARWVTSDSWAHPDTESAVRGFLGIIDATSGPELPVWLASATLFFLTYGFALALVSGFDFYRRLRDSQIRSAALERALTAAQLAALRMQLSPHSLFNLLQSIRGQIEWDPGAARTMIVQLGDLLRRLLSASEREYSRLADELQFARLYLELQQRRFSDRLTIEVPGPAGVPGAWVPSLILQPMIENAVVHGLEGHHGPVAVRVAAVESSGTLALRVTNTLAAGNRGGEGGIGLRNVRDRLAIQFGGRASFEAARANDGQWLAEIRLPLLIDLFERGSGSAAAGATASGEPP